MPQKVYPVASRYGMLRPIEYVWGKGWQCVCDCGAVTVVTGSNLRAGNVVSCGCHRKAKAKNTARMLIERNNRRTEQGELWGVFRLHAERIKYIPRAPFLLTSNKRRRKGTPCWLCRRPARSMLCEKCGGKDEQDIGHC